MAMCAHSAHLFPAKNLFPRSGFVMYPLGSKGYICSYMHSLARLEFTSEVCCFPNRLISVRYNSSACPPCWVILMAAADIACVCTRVSSRTKTFAMHASRPPMGGPLTANPVTDRDGPMRSRGTDRVRLRPVAMQSIPDMLPVDRG